VRIRFENIRYFSNHVSSRRTLILFSHLNVRLRNFFLPFSFSGQNSLYSSACYMWDRRGLILWNCSSGDSGLYAFLPTPHELILPREWLDTGFGLVMRFTAHFNTQLVIRVRRSLSHRLVFSVTVFTAFPGNGFQQWTFLCSRAYILAGCPPFYMGFPSPDCRLNSVP
jgi:hypothetical protein